MIKIYLLSISVSLIAAFSSGIRTSNVSHSAAIIAHEKDTTKLIDSYLTKLSKEKNFSGGLLIIKDGKKIFCKGYGWANKEKEIPFTASTLASMGSITKAFTAAAIMKLTEQNKLSVDDPLKKFFPAIPADKQNITTHQLLTHSSGFHEFLQSDGGDFEKIGTREFLERAFTEPLAFKPGEKAVYTNVGMSILAIILEQVSGLDYEEYLKKNLFTPVGIKHIGYCYPGSPNDTIAVGYQNGISWGTHQEHFEQAGGGPYWNLKGNGGLEASLDEMGLWINAITLHAMLSETTTAKMFLPQAPEEGYAGRSFFGYGCNISKTKRNTKMIDNGGSNGVYFARLIRLPEEGIVFYMVTNESSVNTNMVLPNVTQLFFQGKITQDALALQPKFQQEMSKQVYDIMVKPSTIDLATELTKAQLKIDDDMILLEVGQALIRENNLAKALILYRFYTKSFPNIVVAWNDLGDIYQTQNNKEEAIKCYNQALRIRPENLRAKESLHKLKP
ncbi:MAG TPA: serine hydrolase [Puia sp.]|nr:serine hydrolase [Puia sp.]